MRRRLEAQEGASSLTDANARLGGGGTKLWQNLGVFGFAEAKQRGRKADTEVR